MLIFQLLIQKGKGENKMRKRKCLIGLLFILLGFTIVGVTAYVYELAMLTVTQTIKEIATLSLQNSDLGNIEEGQTLYYTPANQSNLNDIISITTTKANVYLHLASDLDSQTSYYDTYNIVVKYSTVPIGSSHSSGSTACALSLVSPDYSSIDLDVAGSWTFDFEITTTAKLVSADTDTTVTITVTAESSA
jgi:hypothetical protein